jgi:hypothetical protein
MQAFMTSKYRVQACNKREVRRLIDSFVKRASKYCFFVTFTLFIRFEIDMTFGGLEGYFDSGSDINKQHINPRALKKR